ncbi:MAG: PQQ-dependent sugar dehydrogenase [Verrucomicrobiota bacterium]
MTVLGAVLSPTRGQRIVQDPPALPFQAPITEFGLVNAFPQIRFSFLTDRIVGLAVPPGRTNELYVTGQVGRILVITNLMAPTRRVFLDLSDVTYSGGESGLVGLEFHPNFAENRQFFVYYTRTNRDIGRTWMTLSRFVTDPADPYRALPESEQTLIAQPDRDNIHQSGDIHFGPDGYLYVPMGDEGSQNDPFHSSQHIDENFFSAILRIDVDGRPGSLPPNPHPSIGPAGYWIPPDNPFIGATSFNGTPVNPANVRTEFWAVGQRNPHRMHFDRKTGEIYTGDVGGARREEINRIVKGANYGWVFYEGTLTNPYSPYGPAPAAMVPTFPIYEYGRTGGDPNMQGSAVIGGLVYYGTNYPSLDGKYIFGDYISAHIWAMTFHGSSKPTVNRLVTGDYGPTGFGLHPGTGEILLAQRNGEKISRLVRQVGVGPALPATLSEVGVFSDINALTVRPEVEPYEVAAPFWSDNAIKRRWFFFQDATSKVQRSTSDQWTFPTGMVWMKHFDLEMVRGNPATKRRIETRFLVKTTNSAYGMTYRWRPDGSDADLVVDQGYDEEFQIDDGGTIRTQNWHYPGRAECMTCHNGAAGFALGFSTRQLNKVSTQTGINQLTRLNTLGVLDPPSPSPDLLPHLTAVDDATGGLLARFKSYVDANCSYCHMPGGVGQGSWDARFSTPLSRQGIIYAPVTADLGTPGAKIIKPGDVNGSVLWRRIAEMGLYHMPPLGTAVINQAGVDLVRKFTENGVYVVSRQLFYNGSAFDGKDAGANSSDDRAIALNKEVLLPGTKATLANVSTYHRGINGVMVDIWNLPAQPTAADIQVRIGNNNQPSTWSTGPSPSIITLRKKAGVAGSDRVTLIWPEGSILRQWVEISVLPSVRTGLESADTFYLGSAPGDTGDSLSSVGVDSNDLLRVRGNPRNALSPAPVTSSFDVNRDRQVDSLDQTLIRANETRGAAQLQLIDLTGSF